MKSYHHADVKHLRSEPHGQDQLAQLLESKGNIRCGN